MPALPKFSNEQEAADWVASHDTTPYMDDLNPILEAIPVVRSRPTKQPVGLRIRKDYLEAVKQVAARKGIPYQTLIQMWLVEKIKQEAPDLLLP